MSFKTTNCLSIPHVIECFLSITNIGFSRFHSCQDYILLLSFCLLLFLLYSLNRNNLEIFNRRQANKLYMEWTDYHDVLLGREILVVQPFQAKKGSPRRGLLWQEIADNLNKLDKPSFKVTKRAVREQYTLLADKFQKRMNEEIKASGISPDELSELDKLLQEIIDLEAEGPENLDSNEAALAADKTKALI